MTVEAEACKAKSPPPFGTGSVIGGSDHTERAAALEM